MKEKIKQLKEFNWKLFFALCALALIPAVYQTIKTFIISSNNQSDVFDIIGQMEWFDLINETLQAFLIVPLYFILNRILQKDKENFPRYTFKTGVISFTIYSIGILIYGIVLIRNMNTEEINIEITNRYLQLETIAFMIGIIVSFVNVVFVVVGKSKNVYYFLIVNTILSLISDFILIPSFGVYGIAISNILVNILLAIFSFSLLYRQGYIKVCKFHKSDVSIIKSWCKIGMFSGVQQFIDNLIYAIMICKMVNLVAEQGNYWNANNFIWGWLLIPITALAEIIKRDCKDGYKSLKQFNYYFVAGIVIIIWVISIPLWTPFYKHAQHLSNANEIFIITIKLIPFYIAYIGSVIIDSMFIGLGKTIYNMITSLVINFIYYGIFYILYLTNSITFTLDLIILMFGLGNVAHWIVSLIEEKVFLRLKERKKVLHIKHYIVDVEREND